MTRQPITRVGLQFGGYSLAGVPDDKLFTRIADAARAAEAAGFDSLWTMDHLHQISTVGSRDEPILEAYTTTAALAAVTSVARLGVLVTACGFRNPALLAKMVTTIDVISGGRAILGIGAGWYEEEYRAYGLDFPPPAKRLAELAEAVQVCRAMFTEYAPRFSGTYHSIHEPLNMPRPLNVDGPPILIGGGGERVTIPLIARLGDACNFFGGPATVRHKIEVLERACAAVGRDSSEITKTWLGHVILTDSEWELHEQLDRLAALLELTPSAARGFALCGTREEVRRQVMEYRSIGVEGFILTVLDPTDLAHLHAVGTTLRKALDE
ncbi:TIGR03560 family F420-dependent LLM class oxidoreductase [Micromonospora aurantiaca]|uniref:TIGR03560 family F420-dependent LLM class oxidoreductase n=1 Tax=Micromonospora aurantiaca (nom. illeg.) TaxID=47850 RepID=UPI000F3FD5CF|nr:TIGR03560 family F420-dependent LLM class oxidoreductase [Micromonospora aurantiaca]RNH97592.1 TIGR03560 family F420-dependent LLM class oxidoreductase [Micromonospora aurantiaca]